MYEIRSTQSFGDSLITVTEYTESREEADNIARDLMVDVFVVSVEIRREVKGL